MRRAVETMIVALSLVLSAWCVATCGIVPMPVHVSQDQPPCHQPAKKECPNPCDSKLKGVSINVDSAILPAAAIVSDMAPVHQVIEAISSSPFLPPVSRSSTVLRI